MADPRHHLHQQGRRRDARTPRRDRGAGGAAHVGVHVPRRLRANAAGTRGSPRIPLVVHHLRRRRLAPSGGAHPARPQHRFQEAPAPVGAGGDLVGQVRARRRGRFRGQRPLGVRPAHRGCLSRVRAAPAGARRPWISTICCSSSSASSARPPTSSRATATAFATCWWTSSRTPTAPRTRSCACSPPSTATCAWWATATSRSSVGAGPTSATSSSSRRRFPTPR